MAERAARSAFDRLRKMHAPTDEEAEFWADDENTDEHNKRFLDCSGGNACEGHSAKVQVCVECGYGHDGDQPTYRFWPCPTATAVDDVYTAVEDVLGRLVDWFGAPGWTGPQLPIELGRDVAALITKEATNAE